MNKKILAVAIVAVLAVPSVYVGLHVIPALLTEFPWEYEDCYLDVVDADSIVLKKEPAPGVYGRIFESSYDGDTMYKTVDGVERPVEMYQLGELGEHITKEIDRKVKLVQEMDEDFMLVQFYGIDADTNSYACYMRGHKYDPNSQLTFLVDLKDGKMYNITSYTREILLVNKWTFEVYDAKNEFRFLEGLGDRTYRFSAQKCTYNAHAHDEYELVLKVNDDGTISDEWKLLKISQKTKLSPVEYSNMFNGWVMSSGGSEDIKSATIHRADSDQSVHLSDYGSPTVQDVGQGMKLVTLTLDKPLYTYGGKDWAVFGNHLYFILDPETGIIYNISEYCANYYRISNGEWYIRVQGINCITNESHMVTCLKDIGNDSWELHYIDAQRQSDSSLVFVWGDKAN